MINVLHIDNTGFVAETIKRYYEAQISNIKHDILVKMHNKYYDIAYAGISDYIRVNSDVELAKYVRFNLMKYDIIHVHAYNSILPLLNSLTEHSDVRIIYTGHGSDIRLNNRLEIITKVADVITVATWDLLDYFRDGNHGHQVIYVPNAVDFNKFKRLNPYVEGLTLFKTFDYGSLDNKYMKSRAFTHFSQVPEMLHLRHQERNRDFFSYQAYPRHLELFEYLIDIKYMKDQPRIPLPFSMTALQMLALGGTVIRDNSDGIVEAFTQTPIAHLPSEVMKTWRHIYEDTRY